MGHEGGALLERYGLEASLVVRAHPTRGEVSTAPPSQELGGRSHPLPGLGLRSAVNKGCCTNRGLNTGLRVGRTHSLLIFIKPAAPPFKVFININSQLNIYTKEASLLPLKEPV